MRILCLKLDDSILWIDKIIQESAFDKKKKKPELNFKPGLALPLSVTRRSIEQLGPGLYREL